MVFSKYILATSGAVCIYQSTSNFSFMQSCEDILKSAVLCLLKKKKEHNISGVV